MPQPMLTRNLAIALALVLGVAAPARALLFVVDTTAVDLGDLVPGDGKCEWATFVPPGERCSLRAAVDEANAWPGEDAIIVPVGTRYEMMIADDLDITEDVIIGPFLATPDDRPVLDANGLDRMFEVRAGARLTLKRVVITGGRAILESPPETLDGHGGAILAWQGALLTLEKSALVANRAEYGSALAVAGGAEASLLDTNIEGNSVAGRFPTAHGTVYVEGTVTIDRSSIAGNFAASCAIDSSGIVDLANSTVAENSGDGICFNHALFTSLVTLSHVTIRGNSENGLRFDHTGVVSGFSSIIAGNGARDCDNFGSVGDGDLSNLRFRHNLDSDGTCGLDPIDDLPSTNPRLGPLRDNGGWTPTLVPEAGSPVIDRGYQPTCPSEDQRGAPRTPGAACEIGAVELLPCIGVPDFDSVSGPLAEPLELEACNTITVGPALDIFAGGALTLRARNLIRFVNGVSVHEGGELTAINDPVAGSGITLP